MNETYPRKTLVSRTYGTGFASWVPFDTGKLLAEDPLLIELVEKGGHTADGLTEWELMQLGLTSKEIKECSFVFAKRAMSIYSAVPLGGVKHLQVVMVYGLYRLTEQGGYERVETLSELEWW